MDAKSSDVRPELHSSALDDQKQQARDLVRWFQSDGRPFIEKFA